MRLITINTQFPTNLPRHPRRKVWRNIAIRLLAQLCHRQRLLYPWTDSCGLDVLDTPRQEVHNGHRCTDHDDILLRIHSSQE